jgi:hypothetical protein
MYDLFIVSQALTCDLHVQALKYGIQKECKVSPQDAAEIVIYGFKKPTPQKKSRV